MSANAPSKHVWLLQADQVPYAQIRKGRSYAETFLRISNETKLNFRAPHTMQRIQRSNAEQGASVLVGIVWESTSQAPKQV